MNEKTTPRKNTVQKKSTAKSTGAKTAQKKKAAVPFYRSTGFRAAAAVVICLLVLLLSVAAYKFGYQVFSKKGMEGEPGREIEVVVTSGMSTMEVGDLLEDRGLIESKWVFLAQKLFYGTSVYPNTYTFNTSMSAQEILRLLNVMPMAEE